MLNNQFDNLSAENEMHSLAQVGAEEQPEYGQFLAEVEASTPDPTPRGWDLFREIHAEVDPILEAKRALFDIDTVAAPC